MSDNPFAEPEDGEKTVIRPSPGGRRPAPAEPPQRPAYEVPTNSAFAVAPQLPSDGADSVAMGVNPLVAAAGPVLQLMARLRNTASQPDPGDLRERAIRAMESFVAQARATGVPNELLPPAHYC